MAYSLEESMGYWVRCVTRAIRARFNQNLHKAGFDLSSEQWAVLVTLWHKDGQTQKYLGEITMLDKTNITRLIDGLEARNLVIRVPDQIDRRQKLIYLTRAGRDMYHQLVPLVEKTLAEAQHGIEPQRLQTCKEVLRQIAGNLTG